MKKTTPYQFFSQRSGFTLFACLPFIVFMSTLMLLAGCQEDNRAKAPKALSWSAPQTREDGSALKAGNIAGFRIYYRLRHANRFSVILVDSPSRTSQALTDLSPGAYEFAITTVDAEGLESRRSAPVLVDLI